MLTFFSGKCLDNVTFPGVEAGAVLDLNAVMEVIRYAFNLGVLAISLTLVVVLAMDRGDAGGG